MSKARAKPTFGDESRWEETLGDLPFGRIKKPEEVAAPAVMPCAPPVEYLSGCLLYTSDAADERSRVDFGGGRIIKKQKIKKKK